MATGTSLGLCTFAAVALGIVAAMASSLPANQRSDAAAGVPPAPASRIPPTMRPLQPANRAPVLLAGLVPPRPAGPPVEADDLRFEQSADLETQTAPQASPELPRGHESNADEPDPQARRVGDLREQLRQRDAEIARLRAELEQRQADPGDAARPELPAGSAAPAPAVAAPRGASAAPNQPSNPTAPSDGIALPAEDETRALERALVKQGGSVLPQGIVEIEPQLDYLYSEPANGRRDTVTTSLNMRLGLPWATQAELSVPYVVYDRQTGSRTVSNLGDIQLGLTSQLVREGEFVPEVLVSGRWKSRSGNTASTPPTGIGSDTLQAAVTALKRQDPIVLFSSLGYTASLGSGRADVGSYVGGKFGAFLAATPETTVFFDVDVNSTFATRLAVSGSNRLVGVAEFGTATVLTRKTLLNVTGGIGFTRQAPNFRLSLSLPTRF